MSERRGRGGSGAFGGAASASSFASEAYYGAGSSGVGDGYRSSASSTPSPSPRSVSGATARSLRYNDQHDRDERRRRVHIRSAFVAGTRLHGKGPMIFSWHPRGVFLASAGNSRVVQILGADADMVDQVVPPSPSKVSALEWDAEGGILAIMQENSKIIVLWNAKTKVKENFDVGVRDGLWISWSRSTAVSDDNLIALGTSRGRVLIFDMATRRRVEVRTEHKRASITAGSWRHRGDWLVFISEAMYMRMCTSEGELNDRFKVKGKPVGMEMKPIAGKGYGDADAVCLNIENKSLILYTFAPDERPLKLRFPSYLGSISAFKWLARKMVVVGFDSGHLVVVSARVVEMGEMQNCVRILKEEEGGLTDVAFCASSGLLAACGGNVYKIVDTATWSVIYAEKLHNLDGVLDKMAWSNGGKTLTLSSTTGCLFAFHVHDPDEKAEEETSSVKPHVVANQPIPPCELFVCFAVASYALLLFALRFMGDSAAPFDIITAATGFHVTL